MDPLTTENENRFIKETQTDMSESNASKHASVAGDSSDTEKAMSMAQKTQYSPGKSIERITAPQRSKKFWWPFSKS